MTAPTCAICNGSSAKFCSSCLYLQDPRTLPSRPSPSHKLAILFPVASIDPQLVWLNCERRIDSENGIAWELPDTHTFVETENLDPKYHNAKELKVITRNVLRGFSLSHTVKVICRGTFLIDGSTPNVCVRQTTRGKMTHDWRGPLVVLRQPGTATDPRFYEDIRGADLRVAADYYFLMEWVRNLA